MKLIQKLCVVAVVLASCGQPTAETPAGSDTKPIQSSSAEPKLDSNGYNVLTPEQKAIIVDKGTERPFSGEYVKDMGEGLYLCARCNEPLYTSKTKFDGHCGWPSFDEEIQGKVKRIPDADGQRTEIQYMKCGAHLGHVFLGEGFTAKNTRHCVNSISLKFISAAEINKKG